MAGAAVEFFEEATGSPPFLCWIEEVIPLFFMVRISCLHGARFPPSDPFSSSLFERFTPLTLSTFPDHL